MNLVQRTSDTHPAPLPYRPDLQGLRAIAIVLVVLHHAGFPWLPGGFVGVDIFFVLSGYLISGLLIREFEATGRIALLNFYARRFKRLLPALIVMLLVTTGAAFWLLSAFEAQKQLASAPFAATWTSNLFYTFTSFDYFDELAARDLFLHTWSLAVEEQFYLLWPLLILTVLSIHYNRRYANLGKQLKFLLLTIIFVASLVLSLAWSVHYPQAAFYLMPSRIWQFTLGGITYLLLAGQSNHTAEKPSRLLDKKTSWLALSSGIALIFASAVGLHSHVTYPGFWALAPSIGAALLIAAGQGLANELKNPLAQDALVWLGDRSYSWYLWHWPVLMLGFSIGFEGQPLPTFGLVLLSLLVAIISYRYIELPFWKGTFSQAKPLATLLTAILIMAATVALSLQFIRLPPHTEKTTDPSGQWRTDVPRIYRSGCDAWYYHARVEFFTSGPPEAAKKVVLFGDSIGAQWFSMVPAIFPEPEWQTLVLTKSACPIVDEEIFYPRIGRIYSECSEWRNAALTILAQKQPDIIIIGNDATYDFDESQWVEGSSRILERLSQAATTVLILPGTPSLGFDGPGCLSKHLSQQGGMSADICTAKDRLQRVRPVTGFLAQAANRFPNVHLLDLNDIVCPDGICSALSPDKVVVFRDSQHLTDSFVRSVIPKIRERLNQLR